MNSPRLTIGRLLLLIAAFGVVMAALQGNHVWFQGVSIMTVVGLLGAAIGAGTETGQPRPAPPFPDGLP